MPRSDRTTPDDEVQFLVDLTDRAITTRSGDPLVAMSGQALRRLARRSQRLRRLDVDRLGALADEVGVPVRRLRLLADAWTAAGRSGIVALGPAIPVEPQIMEHARHVVDGWRRRHFPLDAFDIDIWRNRMTVRWLLPGCDPTAALTAEPLMQVRRTPDGRWHLYRHAVQGEWWPVVVAGNHRQRTLPACLDVVRADPLRLFWGPTATATNRPTC